MIYHLEVKGKYSEDYMHKMDPIITFFSKIIKNQAFEAEQNHSIKAPLSCNLKKEKAELRHSVSLQQICSHPSYHTPTHPLKQK